MLNANFIISKQVLCAPLLCDRIAQNEFNCVTLLNRQPHQHSFIHISKHLPHRSFQKTKFIYICKQYCKVANLEKNNFFSLLLANSAC